MSTTITVTTQAELDRLPVSFTEYTTIYITGGTPYNRIIIKTRWENAHAVLRGNAHAELWGNAHAELWGNAHAELWENAHAELWENAHAVLRGNAHAELWGNAHAELWGNAHAVLRGNAHAELWGNAHAVLWGNAHAVLRGNAHAELWGNAHAELWENAHAELWENAHAELWENAHAELWENASAHAFSVNCTLELFGWAVAWLVAKATAKLNSPNCRIQSPEKTAGVDAWLDGQGIAVNDGAVILFKKVSVDWMTQKGTANQTVWSPGAILEHPNYNPKNQECGTGKYHACSRPYFCDEFRSENGDRYVAISIRVADLYTWPDPQYPHKIAFRACVVIGEVDRYGKSHCLTRGEKAV